MSMFRRLRGITRFVGRGARALEAVGCACGGRVHAVSCPLSPLTERGGGDSPYSLERATDIDVVITRAHLFAAIGRASMTNRSFQTASVSAHLESNSRPGRLLTLRNVPKPVSSA